MFYHSLKVFTLRRDLTHGNGCTPFQIYTPGGNTSSVIRGAIIPFDVQGGDGLWIGYPEVEKLASVRNIHIWIGGRVISPVLERQLASSPARLGSIVSPGIGVGMSRMLRMGNRQALSGYHSEVPVLSII